MKEEIKELLKSNKNLILTGAPGTGKTYLAKNIASQIILDKDYNETVENDNNFKEQCSFVQFHPSYDYTDFVEGLRPIKDKNGNIGFERKDGVFKEFCKKALKNLKDSKKDIDTLKYEEIIKEYLEYFYNDVSIEITNNSEGYKIYGIGGGDVAPIIEINYNESEAELDFTVKTKNDNQYKFNIKLDLYVDYYKKFVYKKPDEWKYKDFVNTLKVKSYHTYIYGFLKAFYDKYNDKIEQEKTNITVQKIEKKDFVFIIDEINRGEISKIFGELFFSVDPGYRGEKGKVQTQYYNLIEDKDEFKDGFYIPENVYIIGTMNDIDRSVESMDFAMRRRFAWKEIKAKDTQDTILSDLGNLKEETIKRMNNLNNEISNIPELSDAYKIGVSYFLKLANYYKGDENKAFTNLWENHLKGLLFEYTRGMPNQKEIIEKLENKIYTLALTKGQLKELFNDPEILKKFGKPSPMLKELKRTYKSALAKLNSMIKGRQGVFKSQEDRDKADKLLADLQEKAKNDSKILESKDYKDLQRKILMDDYFSALYKKAQEKFGKVSKEEQEKKPNKKEEQNNTV